MSDLSTLQDPNPLTTSLWTTPVIAGGATTSSGADGYVVTFPSASTSSTEFSVSSAATYSWANGSWGAGMNVSQVFSSSTNAYCQLTVTDASGNSVTVSYKAGSLFFNYGIANGSPVTVSSITYNAVQHAWWRMAPTSTEVVYETSPDGQNWTSQASIALSTVGLASSGLTLGIIAACYENETNPGNFTFGMINCPWSLGIQNQWSNFSGGGEGPLYGQVSPSPGNTLLAFIAVYSSAPSGYQPKSYISDDGHNWWQLIGTVNDPAPGSSLRLDVWLCENIQPVTEIALGATQVSDVMLASVIEVSGWPAFTESTLNVSAYGTGASSELSGSLTGFNWILGACALMNNTSTESQVINATPDFNSHLDGYSHAYSLQLQPFMRYQALDCTGAISETFSWSTSAQYATLLLAFNVAPVPPAQGNPLFPVPKVEAAFGYQPGANTGALFTDTGASSGTVNPQQPNLDWTWLTRPYWTDLTQRLIGEPGETLIHSTRGRDYELSDVEAGELDLQLNNQDGAFSPYLPWGMMFNVAAGTPYSNGTNEVKVSSATYSWSASTISGGIYLWTDPATANLPSVTVELIWVCFNSSGSDLGNGSVTTTITLTAQPQIAWINGATVISGTTNVQLVIKPITTASTFPEFNVYAQACSFQGGPNYATYEGGVGFQGWINSGSENATITQGTWAIQPYYPNVLPEVPVRASLAWNGRRYGVGFSYATSWPTSFPHRQWSFTPYTGKDVIGVTSQGSMPSAFGGEVLADGAYCYFPLSEYYDTPHGFLFSNQARYNTKPAVGYSPSANTTVYTADYQLATGAGVYMAGDPSNGIGVSSISDTDYANGYPSGVGVWYYDENLPNLTSSTWELWTVGPNLQDQGGADTTNMTSTLLNVYGSAYNYPKGLGGGIVMQLACSGNTEPGVNHPVWSLQIADNDGNLLLGDNQLPAVKVGAFLGEGAMLQPNFNDANADWLAWTGIHIPVSRVYLGGSGDWSVNSDITQMTAAGVQICISIQPSYNPVSSSDLAALTTFLADLQAAGAQCKFAIWHEPYYSGLTAAEYIAAVQYYGPVIRQYYPLVFVTAESSVYYDSENDYYPGDEWVDEVATDYYYSGRDDLPTCSAPADNANPPKPFGLWEFGISQSSYALENSNASGFFAYIQDEFIGRAAAGQPNSELIWFNAGPGTGGYNWLGDDTSEAAGFEGGIANWTNWETPGGAVTLAASTTVAQSGSGSLAMTCTTAGNVGAVHCNVATASDVTTYGLPCAAGDTVNVTLGVYAGTTSHAAQACIAWCNSSGTVLSVTYGTASNDTVGSWTTYNVSAAAPASTAYAVAAVQIDGAAAGEVNYIDNVQLLLTPPSNDVVTAINFRLDARLALWISLATSGNGYSNTSFNTAITTVPLFHIVIQIQQTGETYTVVMYVNNVPAYKYTFTDASPIYVRAFSVGTVAAMGGGTVNVGNWAIANVAVYDGIIGNAPGVLSDPVSFPNTRIAEHYNAGAMACSGDDALTRIGRLNLWSGVNVPLGGVPALNYPTNVNQGTTEAAIYGNADQIQGSAMQDAVNYMTTEDGSMCYAPATALGELFYQHRVSLYNKQPVVTFGDEPVEGYTNTDPAFLTAGSPDSEWTAYGASGFMPAADSAAPGGMAAMVTASPALSSGQLYVRRTFTAVQGQTYRCEGYVKATAGVTNIRATIDWLDDTGAYIDSSEGPELFPASGGYHYVWAEGTPPSNAVTGSYGPTSAEPAPFSVMYAADFWITCPSSPIPFEFGSGFGFDDTYVYNLVSSQRTINTGDYYYAAPGGQGASQQQYSNYGADALTENMASQSEYFPRGPLELPVETTQDQAAFDRANWSLSKYSQPQLRANQISVDASAMPEFFAQLLTIEQGDIVTISRQPAGFVTPVTVQCIVQKIKITAGPDLLDFVFTLSPYFPENAALQSDVAGYNVLGNNALAW